jgi:hypothetical protein
MIEVAAALAALGLLAVACLTAPGARRRGVSPGRALLAGLAGPLTWAVWYVVDEYSDPARPLLTGRPAREGRDGGGLGPAEA